ncbi:methyl-accepting chemotaxis sensory transducer [Thermosipho africanus H17ap60334]|uniref:methyl-accepting chemotaxis protein n=1 Tax=Thermosipho africanus TaxID=2421 RepID=UPI00028C5EFD|nr:cache domain-containing protein [Thermosipho africanus]EKF49899.1 methyl-accepting chemotaxis sensory transducer [Thermosipho africanus H17ap60334]
MKKDIKLALIISGVFLIVILLLANFFVFPQIKNTFKKDILGSFLSEIKIIAKTKSYDDLFDNYQSKGYYFIISKNGTTLNHSDPSKIGKNIADYVPKLFEAMKEKQEGIVEYEFENEKRFAAFAFDGNAYVVHSVTESELFKDYKTLIRNILTIDLPIVIVAILVLGILLSKLLSKDNLKQYDYIKSLFQNISENVLSTSSSTSEIKSMAENTENAINELDKSIDEFAAYMQENSAEIETAINKVKDFTNTIQEIITSSSKLNELTDILTDITEKITDVSDTITVLAINASIETSKETIDREGLSRIAEMIMELSNTTRKLAKDSKNSLMDIEKIITSNILISEKASKETVNVDESLKAIDSVNKASLENIDKLIKISKSTHDAVEELYEGLEQVETAINNISEQVNEFEKAMKNLKI